MHKSTTMYSQFGKQDNKQAVFMATGNLQRRKVMQPKQHLCTEDCLAVRLQQLPRCFHFQEFYLM